MRGFIASVLALALARSVTALPTPDGIVPETMAVDLPEDKCKRWCAKKDFKDLSPAGIPKPCNYKSRKCSACAPCKEHTPCPMTSNEKPIDGKKPSDVIHSIGRYYPSWKLQLPCKDVFCSTSPTEITNTGPASVHMEHLMDYTLIPRGYTADNKQFCTGGFYASHETVKTINPTTHKLEVDPTQSTDMVVLYNPVAGVTTKGSKNPRMELRELTGQSNKKNGFYMQKGRHTLITTQKIMHLPAKKQSVCFVQLFDNGYGAFIEVMTRICSGKEPVVEYDAKKKKYVKDKMCTKGTLYMMVWHRNSETHKIDYTMLAPYTVETKFTLKVTVEDGIMTFEYQPYAGTMVKYVTECNVKEKCGSKDALIYFKTGAYLQKAPKEESNDYVLSYLYQADIKHAEPAVTHENIQNDKKMK